jgi:peroxiredoxin
MKKIFLVGISLFMAGVSIGQANIVYPSGLHIGDAAPGIRATDQYGNTIQLKKLLKKGKVVLIFYRGQWCPYCNKHLAKINDSLSLVSAKGATVITVTPETAANIKKTIEKTKASFTILEDKDMSIMKNYHVNFTLDSSTVERYKKYGIDLEKNNGSNGANLPVPATYIIGTNGKIKYVFFDADYKKRPSVKDILDNL